MHIAYLFYLDIAYLFQSESFPPFFNTIYYDLVFIISDICDIMYNIMW